MPVHIHHIETCVPSFRHSQEYVTEQFCAITEDERTRRLIKAGNRRSGIDFRHSVCEGLVNQPPFDEKGQATTAARNKVYALESRKLAVEVGGNVIANTPGVEKEDITHVIYTSCTGFANPGPDFYLVKDLGLKETVERTVIGFMGCYAAFPTLRMARSICLADPDAVVLAVCLELSSIHMQVDGNIDNIRGNAVFADGTAAAIVSAKSPEGGTPGYTLENFATATIPGSEDDMAWTIGDAGFELVLSSYVPGVIEAEVSGIFERLSIDPGTVDQWAVHPGGKSILDKVEKAMGFPPEVLAVSREILRNYGNMSSSTILFVLKELLKTAKDNDNTAALAFGPGLTVETALLKVRL